jgi:hypothetical protein
MPSADTVADRSQQKLANTGYKEIFTGPGGFDKEIEEVGNHIYPPASVSSLGGPLNHPRDCMHINVSVAS